MATRRRVLTAPAFVEVTRGARDTRSTEQRARRPALAVVLNGEWPPRLFSLLVVVVARRSNK